MREGFSVGLEGFGNILDIGHSPGLDFQEHRIGPVLYFERELSKAGNGKIAGMKDSKMPANGNGNGDASSPKLMFEVGVLFGLTKGTQDTALKLKGAVTF